MMYTRSVHFYEIDQMEIVHHSRYILYFEEARLDAMQQLGFGYERLMEMEIDDDTYQVQVVSWYDNENSYTSQMVRTIKYFAELK